MAERTVLPGPYWRHAGFYYARGATRLLSLSGYRHRYRRGYRRRETRFGWIRWPSTGLRLPDARTQPPFSRWARYTIHLFSQRQRQRRATGSSCSTCVPAGCAWTSTTAMAACKTYSVQESPRIDKNFYPTDIAARPDVRGRLRGRSGRAGAGAPVWRSTAGRPACELRCWHRRVASRARLPGPRRNRDGAGLLEKRMTSRPQALACALPTLRFGRPFRQSRTGRVQAKFVGRLPHLAFVDGVHQDDDVRLVGLQKTPVGRSADPCRLHASPAFSD